MYSKKLSKKIMLIATLIFIAIVGLTGMQEESVAVGAKKNSKKIEVESKKVNGKVVAFYHPTNGGVITSAFGSRWGKMHKGMDISRDLGTDVVACFDGVVKSKFYEADGYGNIVILDHGNGVESRYAHLNGFNVNVGDKVKGGSKIASVGNTGRSTGPHLHFEVRINDEPMNPDKYI